MNSNKPKVSNQEIAYWSEKIKFELHQYPRKQIRIEVNPQKQVIVKAWIDKTVDEISFRVQKRGRWILKQFNFFNQFQPSTSNKRFIPWESFLYLWKKYVLRFKKSNVDWVKLDSNSMIVMWKNKTQIKDILHAWYLNKAKKLFPKYEADVKRNFTKYWVSAKQVKIRSMKLRRWSCSKWWVITLNKKLIQAPPSCIKYVINHEYCHLIEFWHTSKFFKLQDRTMSDRKKQKNKLERLMA